MRSDPANRDDWRADLHCVAGRPSTYYAAKTRPASTRRLRDDVIKAAMLLIWEANYSVYGVRKLWKAMLRGGHTIGRDQTARLMRELGIRGMRRGRKVFTTRSDKTARRPPDLVTRNFTADRPNAARYHGEPGAPPNDVDVAVVSNSLTRFDLAEARLDLQNESKLSINLFVFEADNERLAELRAAGVPVFERAQV